MPPASCQYVTDGNCTHLFNDRELRHMIDARDLWAQAKWVWAASLVGALLLFGEAYLRSRRRFFRAVEIWCRRCADGVCFNSHLYRY